MLLVIIGVSKHEIVELKLELLENIDKLHFFLIGDTTWLTPTIDKLASKHFNFNLIQNLSVIMLD